MSIYIDATSTLHHDQAEYFALTCPHCDVLSHLTPVSVPNYNQLVAFKPNHVGIVYRCDSCNVPLFMKYAVKMHAGSRIELSSDYQEMERPREKFSFMHLPEETERLFREALECFSSGCYNAFGSMCRRTAQSVFADQGDNGKLKMFDQLVEVRELAALDHDTYNIIRKVVFSTDAEPRPNIPELSAMTAGLLLEVLKDLLYQSYVRRGQLQQAMTLRRYAGEDSSPTRESRYSPPAPGLAH